METEDINIEYNPSPVSRIRDKDLDMVKMEIRRSLELKDDSMETNTSQEILDDRAVVVESYTFHASNRPKVMKRYKEICKNSG